MTEQGEARSFRRDDARPLADRWADRTAWKEREAYRRSSRNHAVAFWLTVLGVLGTGYALALSHFLSF